MKKLLLFLLMRITDAFYVKPDFFKQNTEYRDEEFKALLEGAQRHAQQNLGVRASHNRTTS